MNKFLEKYGGWILTGLGLSGMAASMILTAKETPKAMKALAVAQEEHWREEELTDYNNIINVFTPLSRTKKFKVVAPIYLPAFLCYVFGAGCFIGNQIINDRKIHNALMIAGATGGVLAEEFDKYRRAIQAEQGEDVDKRALARAKMTEKELRDEIAKLKEENGPFLYMIPTLPNIIFEARGSKLDNASLHFNRNLSIRGYNDLDEFYRFFGVPEKYYDEFESKNYGWNTLTNAIHFEINFCDFSVFPVETQNGTVVNVIDMLVPPYDINLDYDNPDHSIDINEHFYPLYNLGDCKKIIENMSQVFWDEVVPVKNEICYEVGLF